MKAVVYHGPGKVGVEELPQPRLTGPRDAIVKVNRTALCGTDLHPYRGEIPQFEPGTVLGHEFAGTVVEAGPQVPFAAGQRVFASDIVACGLCVSCAHGLHYQCGSVGLFGSSTLVGPAIAGGQAEYVRVPFADTTLCATPDGVSDEQALFVGDVLSTAYAAVRGARVRPGNVVAVVGAGPVGVLAAACARLAGAAEVVLADSDVRRREGFAGPGPIVAPEQLADKVAELTGGWGAHAVIEAVGSSAALSTAIEAAAPRATVAAVGVHHADAALPAGIAFARELTVRFVVGDPIDVREPVLALLRHGRLDPAELVSHRLPLSAAAEAYDLFDRREAFKIVLAPSGT